MKLRFNRNLLALTLLSGLSLCTLSACGHGSHDEHGHGHGHADEHDHGPADEHGHDEEGTELSAKQIEEANIGIETAEARRIGETVGMFGRFVPNEEKVAHIHPRFAGVIRKILKKQGDLVEKGEVLAVIESNQSLQVYEVHSAVAGMVIERHATLGEFVADSHELFVVADLKEIWAEFQVYRSDFDRAAVGQEVRVQIEGRSEPIVAEVIYVSPITDESTQSKLIRALIPNPGMQLRPGLFVTGELVVSTVEAPVAVKRSAIQTFEGAEVVFGTDGKHFRPLPVKLGRHDAEYVEVVQGVKPGQRYVAKNSFVIKADIEKSAAGHDH